MQRVHSLLSFELLGVDTGDAAVGQGIFVEFVIRRVKAFLFPVTALFHTLFAILFRLD